MQGQQRQMLLQAYALMATAEIEEETLLLPEQMTDDRLNQLSSDTFAMVVHDSINKSGVVWRSLSAYDKLIDPTWNGKPLTTGQQYFSTAKFGLEDYFVFQYAVEWEGKLGMVFPFQFVVFENSATSDRQLFEYRSTLWWWLGGIAFCLIVLQLIILRWGLQPIAGLINDLSAVQQGKTDSLSGHYPEELTVMTDSINQLIQHEAKQRERYRYTLADLAHSIKNPVAIIASALGQAEGRAKLQNASEQGWFNDIVEQNQRINQIVSYQLNRAVGSSAAPFNKAILVKSVCEKIVSALKKVHADKDRVVSINIDEAASFRGDEGDLMELLGNLLDNAFKYGGHEISILAEGSTSYLELSIEDKGPGMNQSEKIQLVHRGERSDTAIPGQGIGLAVVNDIVASYGGELSLDSSSLGGLKVSLSFNWNGQTG